MQHMQCGSRQLELLRLRLSSPYARPVQSVFVVQPSTDRG